MSGGQSDNVRLQDTFVQCDGPGKAALALSTWFGLGLLPFAPGTFGTLAGLPLILASGRLPLLYRILCLAAFAGVALWSAAEAERLLGRKDPCEVVIDEVAGFLLTMTLFPLSWLNLLSGFILFRLFDILKPFPAGRLERVSGGLGVLLDDLVAGLYASLGLFILQVLL